MCKKEEKQIMCMFIVVAINDDGDFDSVPLTENLLQIFGLLIPTSADLIPLIKSTHR